jgi:hypothetical protein
MEPRPNGAQAKWSPGQVKPRSNDASSGLSTSGLSQYFVQANKLHGEVQLHSASAFAPRQCINTPPVRFQTLRAAISLLGM